jgi:WD40 repeat protein
MSGRASYRRLLYLCSLFLICVVNPCLAGGQQQGVQANEKPIFVQQLGHELEVSAGAFSLDGRFMLTGSYDGSAVLWEVAKGLQIRRFEKVGTARSVAFSSDSRLLAIAGDETTVWDVVTGRILARVHDLQNPTVVQFSPNGQFLFVGGLEGATLLELGTFTQLWKHSYAVTAGAFSNRGGLLLATGRQIDLVETGSGNLLRTIEWKSEIQSLGLSSDGRRLLIPGNPAALIDTLTGVEIKKFDSMGNVHAVALSPDGNSALLAGQTVELWNIAEPDESSRLGFDSNIGRPYVLFSPDGQKALVATSSAIQVFDLKSPSQVQSFNSNSEIVWSVAATSDGRYIATGGDTARLWDTMTGQELKQSFNTSEWAHLVAFSPDDKYLLTAGLYTQLWDLQSMRAVQHYGEKPGDVRAVSFSGNGQYIAVADEEIGKPPNERANASYVAELFNTSTASLIKIFGPYSESVTAVALSSKGEWIVIGSEAETVQILGTTTNARPLKLPGVAGCVHAVAFSQDDRYVAAAAHNAYVWDRETGALLKELPHTGEVFSVSFSADDNLLLTGAADKEAHVWDWRSGSEVRSFVGHSSYVVNAIFAKIAKRDIVLTASADNTAGLWDKDGKLICKISSLANGTWTVVDSSGRFDTNDANQAGGLQWFDPKDPTRSYPVETFFRDYYYPALLSRSLSGEPLPPTRSIETLNTVQPDVLIVSAEQKEPGGPLSVVVAVSDVKQVNSSGQEVHSGVYGIRLLRDGRVVAASPPGAALDSDPQPANNGAEDLRGWRQKNAVVTDSNGRARIAFTVDVPQTSSLDRTELAAYAFNSDRVHSSTSSLSVVLKKPPIRDRGTAYLVNIGISRYEDPKLQDLPFSSTDATELRDALRQRLAAANTYKAVIPISLVSQMATRQNIARVLRFLSGEITETPAEEQEFGVVHRAGPDDFVFLSFSGHAQTGEDGSLMIYAYDSRAEGPLGERNLISAADLSVWAQEINAADMTIVLDACGSGAVEQVFRPQSITDSALARLAYDKRLRILAAAPSSGQALESATFRHGLLTYALLERLQSDINSNTRTPLDMGVLLRYARDQVPVLSEKSGIRQQPVLLDFSPPTSLDAVVP